jgi:hypothetical protein
MVPENGTGRDEAIDRFWDQVTQGRVDAAGDLDPADATTIRYLHATDDRPGPTLDFRRHLREELMHAHAVPISRDPSLPLLANGRASQLWPATPQRLPPSQRRWAPALLATAALVLLTLVASLLVVASGRPGRQPLAPALLPAISATPATPESDGVATKPLLGLVIPTIGDDEVFVGFDRFTLPSATALEADMRGGRVPTVFFVVDGALEARVIDAPQPARVIRAGGAEPEEATASGESVTLAAGDGFVLPENGAADLMNLAAEPAIVLMPLLPTNVWPSRNTGIEWEAYGQGSSAWNASAPLVLALKQVTLAPGADLPGANAPNVKQIVAPVDPDRVMDARTTSKGALRNAGDEPLTAYVLTVTSGAPA